jgi:hypothetical protein
MTILSGQLASRHLESVTDPTGMGCFNYQTFNRTNGTKLMFITAYRVCFQVIEDAGETTFFFNQWHNLLQNGHETPNLRRQVLLDLKDLILTRIGQGYNVCISTDANKEINSRNHQLSEWMEQCGLLSVHEQFVDAEYYDAHPIPSTYNQGPNKIDYVLCTPRLFSCVENVTIEAMNEGSALDQRGLIVDFNTDKVLGETANIAKHKMCVLKSFSRKVSSQYREKNRNWELLHGISNDLGNQPLKLKLASKDYERHDRSIADADQHISAYQGQHGDEPPKLQRTQLLGHAYLRRGTKL